MPQFDFYSFSTQIFWFLLSFYFFYFFFVYFYITSFTRVFKLRQKLILFYSLNNLNKSSLSIFDKFFLKIIKNLKF